MRGAQLLQCECGDFFVQQYEREEDGKFTRLMGCSCGKEKLVVFDGHEYTITEQKNGIELGKKHGIYPKEGRRRIYSSHYPYYTLSKKITNL